MKQKLLHIVYIVVGNILIAFALSTLLLENNIIAGGVSGIGIIFNHYFGLSISLSVGILNVCLFVLGFLFLGKVFAMTTLVSTFLFPFLLEFFESQPVFHHYLNDPLLASIIAGCLIGIGVGLVLTILLFQFSFNDTTHVIYGIVTVMMTTIMLNKTLTAGTSLMQLVVISDYYEDIKDMILHDHDAGVTLLASEKGYTEENSKLVLSILPYRKLPDIKEKVNQIDPLAFMIVSHVDEVGGKGFTLEKK